MPDTSEIFRAGFRWHLVDDFARDASWLLGPDGLPLDQWLALGHAHIVKHAPHRTVYRVILPDLDLHIKHYRGETRDYFRRLFRGSRARREFDLSREVARRGVPTVEVLAYGDSGRFTGPLDSFLISRTLPGTVSLLDFLESDLPALPRPQRLVVQHQLAVAVGKLLAAQHRVGVLHTDLHPGNILLRFVEDQPELYLIDLNMVRLSRRLDWRASRDNLVPLDRWFALRWSRTDRRRAWRAYCLARDDLVLEEPSSAREIERLTQKSQLRRGCYLDARCLGGNRHYRKLRASGLAGHAVADLDPSALAELLADPDAPFAQPDARVLKQSVSSSVIEMTLPGTDRPRPVIYKRFNVTTWLDALASLFRPPPALRSYITGHGFRFRGLPTPRPLAVWHRRRFGLLCEGYLLMEKVPQAMNLLEFLDSLTGLPILERRQRLWQLLDELAGLLRTLHCWQLSHRDLKAANLLVSPASWAISARGVRELPFDPEVCHDRVWFIDLVGVRRCRELGYRRRVRDLARLHVSFLEHPGLTRSDRLRFLLGYLFRCEFAKEGWKAWWNAIDCEARDKVRRNQSRGRAVG